MTPDVSAVDHDSKGTMKRAQQEVGQNEQFGRGWECNMASSAGTGGRAWSKDDTATAKIISGEKRCHCEPHKLGDGKTVFWWGEWGKIPFHTVTNPTPPAERRPPPSGVPQSSPLQRRPFTCSELKMKLTAQLWFNMELNAGSSGGIWTYQGCGGRSEGPGRERRG